MEFISINAGIYISGSAPASCVHILHVSNVSMTHNTAEGNGGGISLELPAEFAVTGDNSPSILKEEYHNIIRKIIIKNSAFEDNKGSSGSAISLTACEKHYISSRQCTISLQILFEVQNTTFTSNSGSPLYLYNIGYVKVITSRFISNNGSGILSDQSNIYMEGDILFAENTAAVGGGN